MGGVVRVLATLPPKSIGRAADTYPLGSMRQLEGILPRLSPLIVFFFTAPYHRGD